MSVLNVSSRVGADGSMEFFDSATGATITNIGLTSGSNTYVKKRLTPAQILALNTTPQTIVAAPGAGKMIYVKEALLHIVFATTAYAAGSAFQLQQNSITVASTTAALVNSGSDLWVQMAFPAYGTTASLGASNAALIANIAGGAFTTGDSPIDVHVWYSLLS